MEGKIILEEHFTTALNNQFWDSKGEETRNGKAYSQNVASRLLDPEKALGEMDRAGIEHCILSLTSPGVQSIVDSKQAADVARSSNDYVHSIVARHLGRFSAFAAVALQDPGAAAEELERSVQEYGFKGALINGYSNTGSAEQVLYLDEQPVWEFWDRVSKLNIPVYLHPREPLSSQTRSIAGYPGLVGSAWGFGYETGSHAVRLILSGLFDRYPNLQIILGHLGEGLPYLLPRLQHRLNEQHDGETGSLAKRRASYYFKNNFWLTTSGHFQTNALVNAMAEIGAERIMFSVDYPFEQMHAASSWFDELALDAETKLRLGRKNAQELFSLNLGTLSVDTAA